MRVFVRHVSHHVFHHDHRGVDHDAEINSAQRDKVGGGSGKHHSAEGNEKRKRDVDRRDERGAVVSEEQDQDDRDEDHAEEQVLDDGMRRQADQHSAVVKRFDIHAGREEMVLPDVLDALVNTLQRRQRLAPVSHEDRSFHDIVFVVFSDDSQSRHASFVDPRDIAKSHRCTFLRGDGDVGDVAHSADQPDAAHRERLLP